MTEAIAGIPTPAPTAEGALIPVTEIQIGAQPVQAVSARELHALLEAGRDFSNWIKDRIEFFEFAEGVDFVRQEFLSSPNPASAKSRPQKVIEYYLTLDMAKELAMVERNAKGKQARRYFIECERRLREALVLPDTVPELEERIKAAKSKLTYMKFLRSMEYNQNREAGKIRPPQPGEIRLGEAAMKLRLRVDELRAKLKAMGWLLSAGGKRDMPNEETVARGHMVWGVEIDHDHYTMMVRITMEGMRVLSRAL